MGRNKAGALLKEGFRPSDKTPVTKTPFIPTVHVERPVLWVDEGDRRDYTQLVRQALGKSFTRTHAQRFNVVPAEQQAIVQVHSLAFAEQSYQLLGDGERQATARKFAQILQNRLNLVLGGVDEQLVLCPGNLALADREPRIVRPIAREQEVVAVSPKGWRGHSARYPAQNSDGSTNACWQLKREHKVLVGAIGDAHSWLDPQHIVADPSITLLEKRAKVWPTIPKHDLACIDRAFAKEGALPDVFLVGDPVVVLQTGERGDIFERFPVRDFDVLPRQLAA